MAQKRCFGCMQLKENSPVCEHCGFNEFAQNESHQLPLGTVLRQQYMVGKALGQGGFGITYLGWDLNLDIPIAIKEYYPNSIVNRDATHSLALTGVATNMADLYVSTRQRFLREAKVLAKLRNVPNIVQVHNFFEENNTAYIIMEYVKGIDLRRYMNLRGGRLSVEETLTILKPVMQALQRVHDHEIVHRDISPDNIMMMPDGTAKLLDFGAVRNVENADTEKELQQSTEAILKHGFAPMEQYQKRGALGPWTDEYAMCATIYYCLTGRVPPDAPQRMMEDVHPAWERIPGLTAHQRQVLEKGMSLRAKDRYASINDLMAALYAPVPTPVFEPEPIQVTKPVAPIAPEPEPEKPLYTAPMVTRPLDPPDEVLQKKKPGGLIVAAVALVAALAAGAWMLGGKNDAQMHAPETQAVATTEAPETTAPVETTEATEPLPVWYDNVLMVPIHWLQDDYSATGAFFQTDIDRYDVDFITFRATTAGAPVNAYDVSYDQNGSVLLWCEFDSYWGDNVIIAAEGGINAKYCDGLFLNLISLKGINFNYAFHTDEAEDMSLMFGHCRKLKELDLSGFNTANVTDMASMFDDCDSLTKLDFSSWDTSNVKDMCQMFMDCDELIEVDLSNWDTSSVTTMENMFLNCSALEIADVSGFQTSKVTNVSGMFGNCHRLNDLQLSNWDVFNVSRYVYFMDSGDTVNGKPWEEFFR